MIYSNILVWTKSFNSGYDNRCLKPDDSKDPEEWDHYDPDEFYDATTQEFSLLICKDHLTSLSMLDLTSGMCHLLAMKYEEKKNPLSINYENKQKKVIRWN